MIELFNLAFQYSDLGRCGCGFILLGDPDDATPEPVAPDTDEYRENVRKLEKLTKDVMRAKRPFTKALAAVKRDFKLNISTHITALKAIIKAAKTQIKVAPDHKAYANKFRQYTTLRSKLCSKYGYFIIANLRNCRIKYRDRISRMIDRGFRIRL
jgi:hypothetical protein